MNRNCRILLVEDDEPCLLAMSAYPPDFANLHDRTKQDMLLGELI